MRVVCKRATTKQQLQEMRGSKFVQSDLGNIFQDIKKELKEGMTILVVDKNLKEMDSLLDRHYIVEKGHVVWQGTVDELEQQEAIRNRYLGV